MQLFLAIKIIQRGLFVHGLSLLISTWMWKSLS